jgi:hypothetical protein
MKIKNYLRKAGWFRLFRLLNIEWRLARSMPNWRRLLTVVERDRLSQLAKGKRVLIATSVGMHLSVNTFDSLLAVALSVRGAEVEVLLCDGALPACMAAESNWFEGREPLSQKELKKFCRMCPVYAQRMYKDLNITVRAYSEVLLPQDYIETTATVDSIAFEDIATVVADGIRVGEQAWAGALRYFARGDLAGEPNGELVLRRYFQAALLTARAGRRLMANARYEVVVLHHGIYVPQGILAETARQAESRVVTWNPAYRRNCFIFSHDDTYHHTMMNEPQSTWEDMHWDARLEQFTLEYLESRRQGSRDWIAFNKQPCLDFDKIAAEFRIDRTRPMVALFTNVAWDAQIHYPTNAFANMLNWVEETIRYFVERPDLQLVIRIHPAELSGALQSRQPLQKELSRLFPRLPENVRVISPEHPASSYVVAAAANAALIYGTKMGVELSSAGLPVIVAGEAWIRNKGITLDADSRQQYLEMLGRLPLSDRLPEETITRARQYAFHFFFRRMIYVNCVAETSGWPPFTIDAKSLDDLTPEASPGLEVICRGILEGTPFVDHAESRNPV